MENKRTILFTGDGSTPRRGAAFRGRQPKRNGKYTSYIILCFVALVCIAIIMQIINARGHRHISNIPRPKLLDDIRKEGKPGYHRIARFLLDPQNDYEKAICYLQLFCVELRHPDLLEILAEQLPNEKGDNCLVSLALCLAEDIRGLPRFIRVLEDDSAPTKRLMSANFFNNPNGKSHPLQEHYNSRNDREWAVAIIQDMLRHSFGCDTQVCRAGIIEWWKTHKNGTMDEWQREFLATSTLENKSNAFLYFYYRSWSDKNLLKLLTNVMMEEKDDKLKQEMAYRLFKRGVKETLPIMDKYVMRAVSPEEISLLLATLKTFVSLPEEFMEIDKWQEGRDDQKAFNWLREWWIRNNQFLVFKDSVWMIGGIDESDPENKLLD